MNDVWFKKDCASKDISRLTIDLLRQTFDGRLISRNGDINGPPFSWDLTPLSYFMWDAVKENCYADKPEIFEHLKANICDAIAEVRLHTAK